MTFKKQKEIECVKSQKNIHCPNFVFQEITDPSQE